MTLYTHTPTYTYPHTQPLMQRVQAALGAQLARQNEKLEIELREKVSTVISPTESLIAPQCVTTGHSVLPPQVR